MQLDETRRHFVRVQLARNRVARAAQSFAGLAGSVGPTEEMIELGAELTARLDTLGGHRDAAAQGNLGRAMMALEDYAEAAKAFARALNASPPEERAAVAILRAQALIQDGRSEEALRMLEAQPRPGRPNPEFQTALADALAAVGRTASARLEYLGVLQIPGLSDELRAEVKAKHDALRTQ